MDCCMFKSAIALTASERTLSAVATGSVVGETASAWLSMKSSPVSKTA